MRTQSGVTIPCHIQYINALHICGAKEHYYSTSVYKSVPIARVAPARSGVKASHESLKEVAT